MQVIMYQLFRLQALAQNRVQKVDLDLSSFLGDSHQPRSGFTNSDCLFGILESSKQSLREVALGTSFPLEYSQLSTSTPFIPSILARFQSFPNKENLQIDTASDLNLVAGDELPDSKNFYLFDEGYQQTGNPPAGLPRIVSILEAARRFASNGLIRLEIKNLNGETPEEEISIIQELLHSRSSLEELNIRLLHHCNLEKTWELISNCSSLRSLKVCLYPVEGEREKIKLKVAEGFEKLAGFELLNLGAENRQVEWDESFARWVGDELEILCLYNDTQLQDIRSYCYARPHFITSQLQRDLKRSCSKIYNGTKRQDFQPFDYQSESIFTELEDLTLEEARPSLHPILASLQFPKLRELTIEMLR